MDTPVTISSNFSSVRKPKNSAAPLSDSGIDRESSCTPTTLLKVNNWISSLNRRNSSSDSSSHRQNFVYNDFGCEDLGGTNLGHRTKPVFSDSSKSEYKDDNMIEDELNQYYKDSYGKIKEFRSATKICRSRPEGPKKHSHPKATKRRKLEKSSRVEKRVDLSDYSGSNTPLSPESEKKKELCSYLQLMKPTDKKTVMTLQNRRSVRVKNLGVLQEKRELEKKLREGHLKGRTDSLFRIPSLGSEEDENKDRKRKWSKNSQTKEAVEEKFNFPRPMKDLGYVVNDFDEATQEEWFLERNIMQEIDTAYRPREKAKNKLEIERKLSDTDQNVKSIKKKKSTLQEVVTSHTTIEQPQESLNSGNNTKSRKVITEKLKSNSSKNKSNLAQFSVPKPPVHLELDITDFADVFQDEDLVRDTRISDDRSPIRRNKELKPTFPSGTVDINPANIIEGNRDTFGKMLVGHETPKMVKESVLTLKKKSPQTKKKTLKNGQKEHDIQNSKSKNIPVVPEKKEIIKKQTELSNPEVIFVEKTNSNKNGFNQKSKKKKKLEQPKNSLKRSSSFKIKLFTKKKKLESPNKSLTKNTNVNVSKNEKNAEICGNSIKVVPNSPMKRTRKFTEKQTMSPNSNIIIDDPEKLIRKKSKLSDDLKRKTIMVPDNYITNQESGDSIVGKKEKLFSNQQHSPSVVHSSVEQIKVNFQKTEETVKPISQLRIMPPKENCQEVVDTLANKNLIRFSTDKPTPVPKKTKVTQKREESPPCEIINAIFKDGLLDVNSPENHSEFYYQILDAEKSSNDTSNSPIILDAISLLKNVELPEVDQVKSNLTPFISFQKDATVNPLHSCLNASRPREISTNLEAENSSNWTSNSPTHRTKKNQHSIHISKEEGVVLKIFYVDYNLVLCQEFLVSVWTQTALGNVLGAQNMWVNKGSVQRLAMNNNCSFKESLEMVVCTDSSLAYIELWTKEHRSDKREGPVADIFATVYFWKKGHTGLDKKVLQLENINGFADDVQYSIVKSSPRIVVSWHLANSEMDNKKTSVHCYQLAADFQSLCNISEFESVDHYVSSLHNIEGCDTLIMGCGENKITLWNIDRGYVAATIEMLDIKCPLSTLWVKCDRGFLFTLQQCVDRELRLIAIHGMIHSWKKLASYVPPEGYDRYPLQELFVFQKVMNFVVKFTLGWSSIGSLVARLEGSAYTPVYKRLILTNEMLKGVCVENGLVLAFYDKGVVCWNAQTAKTVLETRQNESEYVSGKYIISIVQDQVNLRHVMTHVLSAAES